MQKLLLIAAVATLTGCAGADGIAPAGGSPSRCGGDVNTLASAPGKAWLVQHRWRFKTDADAAAAYAGLAKGASPWPDWFSPPDAVLQPGTRFQMALGVGQPTETPGSFGTFDLIRRVRDVRDSLAVRQEWKPKIDRVATYEVVKPINVKIGPVGPQVDGQLCKILPGRGSQFQMLVPRGTAMDYLTLVEVRPIR